MSSNKIQAGVTFTRWTVLSKSPKRRGKRAFWLCKCSCGIESFVLQENLTSGKSKSCGCLGREATRARGQARHGSNNPNWVGGRVYDDKGYIRLYYPRHPSSNSNGYIQEHRVVAEKALGRTLKVGEFIHHIDGDKTNNANHNLVICDRGLHQTIHKRTRRIKNE